jgi:hypothetical protein
MSLEYRPVFCAGIHLAPFATCNIETTRLFDIVVCPAKDYQLGRCILPGGGKGDSILELEEQGFNGGWGISLELHTSSVLLQLFLGDAAKGGVEIGE